MCFGWVPEAQTAQDGNLQILRGLQKHSRNEGADLKTPSKSLSQSSPKAKQKHSSHAWGFTFSKSQVGHFVFSLPEDKAATLAPCSSTPEALCSVALVRSSAEVDTCSSHSFSPGRTQACVMGLLLQSTGPAGMQLDPAAPRSEEQSKTRV